MTNAGHSPECRPNDLREQPCALCGCWETWPLPLESCLAGIDGTRRIVECRRCGLRFVSPRPGANEARAYYSREFADAYRNMGLEYAGGMLEAPRYLRERLARLEAMLGLRGALLDVGAGTGAFAKYAKEAGWRVVGTEISETAAEGVRRLGVEMRVGEISDSDLSDQEFDVVHLNHVLEHLRDPLGDLERLAHVLRPGGLLAVEVPQEFSDLVFVSRRRAGLLKSYPVASPHLWFFTPITLRGLVEKAGFRVEVLETLRRGHAGERWPKALIRRVVDLVERLLQKGPIIVIIARRIE